MEMMKKRMEEICRVYPDLKSEQFKQMMQTMFSKPESEVSYLRCSTKLSIASDPPQGPRSKTKMALSHSRMDKVKMMNPQYVASISDRSMIDGVHYINIFVTDKSLAQTEQIRYRYETSGARFNENIIDYSSKAKSGITDVDQLLSRLFTRPKKDTDLIDSVICCAHHKRFEDIVEVIDSINRNQYNLFESCGIHTVYVRLIFDECDVKQNVTNLNKMLTSFKRKGISVGENSVIRDIVFVSATPDRNFWNMLKKHGINELHDIKYMLEQDGLLVKMTTEEYKASYTSYQSHRKTYCDFDNPHEMLESLWLSMLDKWRNVLGRKTGMRVFCPGTRYNDSHYEIRDYCKKYGYACLVHNGTDKCIFMPDGENVPCPGGEMRDFLADWNTKHPNTHLVITGNLTIRRGLTFVTKREDGTGFQFNFGLFANNVFDGLEESVQLVSRLSGHADYADKCEIYISEKQNKVISEWFDRKLACVDSMLKVTMETYVAPTQKDIDRKNMNIPLVFAIERDEMNTIIEKKNGKRYDTDIIKKIIDKYDSGNVWSNIMETHTRKQITLPQSVKSINKMIVDLEYFISSNTKWCKDFSKKDKENSCYSIILDKGWDASKRDVTKSKRPYTEAVYDETQQPKLYLMYYTKRAAESETSSGDEGPLSGAGGPLAGEGGAAGGGGRDPSHPDFEEH